MLLRYGQYQSIPLRHEGIEIKSFLSKEQIAAYRDDGFLFPLPVLSVEQAFDYRMQLETIERDYVDSQLLRRPLSDYIRTHSDVIMPMAAELALQATVLDAVESILGPDLMVWGADFFIKEAYSPMRVTMHQDLTYWGLGETSNQVTAWIALSASTVESGCVNLLKGSHKNTILPHTDTLAGDNLLSRGQEVEVDVRDEDCTHVVLEPGEMSLHHGLAIHGSNPNKSNDRRIGFAVRYISPDVGQKSARREYAMLARGVDRSNGFIHYAPPSSLFSASSLSLYEEIKNEQSKVLMADIKNIV